MKYLVILLLTVTAFAFDYPIAINGHTLNIFDSKPTTVKDKSAEGNDGTVYGATMTDDGMSFDGVNDYIDVGDIGIYDFHDVNFSLATWVKTDKPGYFMQKSENTGYYYGWRFYINPQGLLDCLTVSPVKHATGTSIVTNDTWTFAVFTLSNGVGRIYCNGTLESTTAGMNPTDKSLPLIIGKTSVNTAYFSGNLCNTAIYRDKALTLSEITTLYNAGRNAPKDVISTNGLVLFYDFDLPERTLTLQEPTYFYDDLAGWWKLQGNALDYSKNENDGTVYGAVSTGTNYYFDGISDYVNCGNDISLQNNTFTILCWFYSTDKTKSIITKGTSRSSFSTHDWDLFGNGTKLNFRISDGSVALSTVSVTYPTISVWHFVAVTWNGTTNADSLIMYIDGVEAGTATPTGTNITQTKNVFIGGYGSYSFVGYQKGVRIYNRALTAEEINEIYNATK